MRIVFMGTPEIAQVALSVLLSEGHEVRAVYTRPDKPVGRKQIITPSPVKVRAAENRIPVLQPVTLKEPGSADQLAAYAPDLVVVVAYGVILPPEILAVPAYGCVNMHVSLLPKYRGAAPIQWAVINGEQETGITIMKMDEGLDTGPVYAQQKVDIPPEATAGELFEIVTGIGARLLADTVAKIETEGLEPTPQQGEVSHAPQLIKEEAGIDFTRPAAQLHNLIRGCNPWPVAWFTHDGKRIKVAKAKVAMECGKPGEIVRLDPLTVCCGEDSLALEFVNPEGSRRMTGAEWASGRRFEVGASLL